MAKLKVYEYEKCSTCRDALKFLDKKKIPYERVPIVEHPPSLSELKKMVELVGGDFRKLFNTSGMVYRELKLSEKIGSMSVDEALRLLTTNGKLIKRPFVLGANVGVVGFREPEWAAKLAK